VAYVSTSGGTEFTASVVDLPSGTRTPIAKGLIDPDSLEWSPDGREVLYVSIVPNSATFALDNNFQYSLNLYNLDQNP
jgi:sugar lactone lactonase YvrE